MALKVILHVSTGRGPGAPCVLAPSLDHNTDSIDSCVPSFPRCPQSRGLMVPAHRLLSHRIHPRRRPGLARRADTAPAHESPRSRLKVMTNVLGPVLPSLEWRPARAHPLPMPSLPTHSPGYTVGMSPDSAPTTEMEGKATLVHCVLPGESGEG